MTISRYAFVAIAIFAATAQFAVAQRFDLSATTGRRDAETREWTEWEIGSEGEASLSSEGVTVTLRGVDAPLEGFLHKRGLATGATLASDGVRCEAGEIEIVLSGLGTGSHSLATYHNAVGDDVASAVRLTGPSANGATVTAQGATTDPEMAAVYVGFDAVAGEAVTLRLASEEGAVLLNALELDASDPNQRTQAPSPADYDGHVAPDSGVVRLGWKAPAAVDRFRVFTASHADPAEAERLVLAATEAAGEVADATHEFRINPNDSLTHHAWRVDAVMTDGSVVQGEVWRFRVRHLAFPGAEGYGRFARGGRGGRVLHVTNLNDSGLGSLRAAIEAEGPRTVVFDVSGRIVLKNRLSIRNGELTIAGQTAPGNGVCISNYNVGGLGADDVVIRYLRVRPGDTSGQTLDGMGLASCDHAIVDHCSISWTQDESFSSRGALNITLQRTLISEALNIAGHKKYAKGKSHGFAASIGGDRGSFHHNLLAHCAGRNWSLAGGVDQANRHRGQLDLRNNVVYNWDHRTTDGGARLVQFVNNYYKPGPATRVFHVLMPEREWTHVFGPQDYYASGNVMEGRYGPSDDRFAGIIEPEGEPFSEFFYDEPFFESYVETQSAEEAYPNVLADVGCNFPALDEHDKRVLREVRDGTTTYVGSKSGKPGLPDSQKDVGGWDDYAEVHRAADWDADGDGMPAEWERSHGFNPDDPSDGSADPDGDGYTNLEDFLSSLTR